MVRRKTALRSWGAALAWTLGCAVQAGPPPQDPATELFEYMAASYRTATGEELPRELRRDAYMFSSSVFASYQPPPLPAMKSAVEASLSEAANSDKPTADVRFDRMLDAVLAVISPRAYRFDAMNPTPEQREQSRKLIPATAREVGSLWVITMAMFEGGDDSVICLEREVFTALPRDAIGVVLDLRGNVGGNLWAVECIVGEFAGLDVPVYQLMTGQTREVARSRKQYRRDRSGASANIELPLVVLVDGETNSAALLLAATLRDLGRARLAGQAPAHINGAVFRTIALNPPASFTPGAKRDVRVSLPAGELGLRNGKPLAAGVTLDKVMDTADETALLAAAGELMRKKR